MIFDAKTWAENAKGFSVVDCAIRSKDMYMLVLAQDNPEEDVWPLVRFLMVYADDPVDERFYHMQVSDFRYPSIAFHDTSGWEFIATDLNAHVYSHRKEKDGREKDLPTSLPNSTYITPFSKCVRVNGELYAVAWDRRIFRRVGESKWDEITQHKGGIPYDQRSLTGMAMLELGFNDLAGFSSDDMYAVGGKGDVWHFNGKKWQQIHFPSNELLFTVCCAGDGNVYITGNNGSLWVGRGDRWKRLAEGKFSQPFKDTEWFAGRLFCGGTYGLWVLNNGELEPLKNEVDSIVATSAGRIDISPDGKLMLTAGRYGAAMYDGKNWEVLFNSIQLA